MNSRYELPDLFDARDGCIGTWHTWPESDVLAQGACKCGAVGLVDDACPDCGGDGGRDGTRCSVCGEVGQPVTNVGHTDLW